MKAKEIINLCESNGVTSREVFNSINNYVQKKFKQAGMRVSFDEPDDRWFDITLSSNPDVELQQSRYRQCCKDLSRFLGRATRIKGVNGYRFKVFLPKIDVSVDNYWERNSIFNVELYLIGVQHEIKIIVTYSDAFMWLIKHNGLAVDDTFTSEEGLSEVHKLVDLIVKAIRLISVE